MACSLTFDPSSQGTLFTVWSQEVVEGALASFVPVKSVPAFKFKNGGRSELMREMSGGTGERIKRYYSGFCQFVKLAKSFDGKLTLYDFDVLPKVDICLLNNLPEGNVVKLSVGKSLDLDKSFLAVGTVPHPSYCFDATTMSQSYFTMVGHREGAAISI